MDNRDDGPPFDAVILAGGAARRLDGVAKPQLVVGGATLLDRVLGAVPDAATTVVVGPRQPVARPVTWAQEDPPGGGPVAALAAAVPLTSAPVVLVLAADLPWIAGVVPDLRHALDVDRTRPGAQPPDVAVLDGGRRPNYLAAAWRRAALVAALERTGPPAGAAMRTLLDGLAVAPLADTRGWGADCDTWDDVARARDLLS